MMLSMVTSNHDIMTPFTWLQTQHEGSYQVPRGSNAALDWEGDYGKNLYLARGFSEMLQAREPNLGNAKDKLKARIMAEFANLN